jgi:acyl-CoA dehydrogenase
MEILNYLSKTLFAETQLSLLIGGFAVLIILTGYFGAPLLVYSILTGVLLSALSVHNTIWYIYIAAFLLLNVPPIRRYIISFPLLKLVEIMKIIPPISASEMQALRSGNAWVDADLFSGNPFWRKLRKSNYPSLTKEEKAFINGPVKKVCEMADDWKINQIRDLPNNVWSFLKKKKFFGMIIPKEYGGLGFSAEAHSQVIKMLSSRSLTLSVTAMVPNSLGPGELILNHGTDKQKKYYLPRLADGREVPCFALTEPNAGSDAGGITSSGEIIKLKNGKLGVKLNWDKRYITLASVATLLGLAVKIYDPKEYLKMGKELGITCILVNTKLKGVETKHRHDPLGIPFHNCPTTGKNVIVSIDDIIGGIDGIGHGWAMLMACLAAGRGISLPATGTGGAALVSRVVGDYAAVRHQFGIPIGKLEGLHDPIGHIGGYTYLLEAARKYTTGGIDNGAKPPVITAIAKYHFTEIFRKIINDGMDVLGGAAISKGPRNLLANIYCGTPIIITVEGANIMTRTLIHFGQGLFRCHPYAFKVVDSILSKNITAFDKALWSHAGHVAKNIIKSTALFLTRGRILLGLGFGKTASYYKRLTWVSSFFAVMADAALILVGGNLKRKGMLSGRYGDVLSWMYLITTALRRYEEEGKKREYLPYVTFAAEKGFSEIQNAFQGIFRNMGGPILSLLFTKPLAWMFRLNSFGKGVNDNTLSSIAFSLQKPNKGRDGITEGIFIPASKKEALGKLEYAFSSYHAALPIEKKIKAAQRRRQLPRAKTDQVVSEALKNKVISKKEYTQYCEFIKIRNDAALVDAYNLKDYLKIGTAKMK